MDREEKQIKKLMSDASIFLLAYELGGGKDLDLVRHSVDSRLQADKLKAKLAQEEQDRGL